MGLLVLASCHRLLGRLGQHLGAHL
eukprot:SAG11_NODE_34627_length_271_cov_0.395349_1_plen_24_part_01